MILITLTMLTDYLLHVSIVLVLGIRWINKIDVIPDPRGTYTLVRDVGVEDRQSPHGEPNNRMRQIQGAQKARRRDSHFIPPRVSGNSRV